MPEPNDGFDSGLAALNRLSALLAEETRLIALGRIDDGLALAAEKAECAAVIQQVLHGLQEAQPAGPDDSAAFETLRQTIEAMQETLAVNLAVLATARSVAENILRDVARRLHPQLATAFGPGSAPRDRSAGAPLLLSRKL